MRFARENELHRPRRVVEQLLQSLFVAEQKRAAFVSGETPRKSDRQNFRIENAIDVANRFRRIADALALRAHAFAHELDQTQFELLVRVPKLRVGNIHDAAPEIFVRKMFFPFAEMFSVKRGKLRRHPGFGVHAVGDARDRHFVHRHARPNIFPKRPADVAVQFADAVSVPAETQRQDRHAERIRSDRRAFVRSENNSSNGICNSRAKCPKYFRIISRENESLPAGTGVCVVKTLAAATTCRAE